MRGAGHDIPGRRMAVPSLPWPPYIRQVTPVLPAETTGIFCDAGISRKNTYQGPFPDILLIWTITGKKHALHCESDGDSRGDTFIAPVSLLTAA